MKRKHIYLVLTIAFVIALPCQAQERPPTAEKTTIKLLSGEIMMGTVAGVKDQSVNLITDYGVIKVPIIKLSEETRKELKIAPENDATTLKNRITELEALVASLREENASLRKNAGASAQTLANPTTSQEKVTTPPTAGVEYRLSDSGKRHNSRCRFFNSAGRPCTANDGVACKVCGG